MRLYTTAICFLRSLPVYVSGHITAFAAAMISLWLERMLQYQHNCSRVTGNYMGNHAVFLCATEWTLNYKPWQNQWKILIHHNQACGSKQFFTTVGSCLSLNTLRTGLLNCLNARSRGLTFRHRASCKQGQAFRYSPENAFYIFNQQIYFII